METRRMDLSGNKGRVDKKVNPDATYNINKNKVKRPIGNEQKEDYKRSNQTNSVKQEDKNPTQNTRSTNSNRIKDRANVEDTLFKQLTKGLLELENNYHLDALTSDGKRIKDLPIREFYSEVAKQASKCSIAKRAELNKNAAPHVASLQICLNYMEYYKIIKIKFDIVDGCREACKVLETMVCEEDKRLALQRTNVLLSLLHRNDLRGNKSINIPIYRFIRMICVLITYRDFISASVFSRMILSQVSLDDKRKKGDLNKDVRQDSKIWRAAKN